MMRIVATNLTSLMKTLVIVWRNAPCTPCPIDARRRPFASLGSLQRSRLNNEFSGVPGSDRYDAGSDGRDRVLRYPSGHRRCAIEAARGSSLLSRLAAHLYKPSGRAPVRGRDLYG